MFSDTLQFDIIMSFVRQAPSLTDACPALMASIR